MESHTKLDEDTWYIDWIKPQSSKRFTKTRAKTLSTKDITPINLKKMEGKCFRELVRYRDNKHTNQEPSLHLLNLLFEYEFIVLGYRSNTKSRIYETLNARPWVDDDCVICREVGVETIIFRGNNRNRRRGFHNSFIFYNRFKDIVSYTNK